jgi:hypothetical protein
LSQQSKAYNSPSSVEFHHAFVLRLIVGSVKKSKSTPVSRIFKYFPLLDVHGGSPFLPLCPFRQDIAYRKLSKKNAERF